MSTRFTIQIADSESNPELVKDSAHVFVDADDRMEDLSEPHVHVEFTGADLIDMSTNHQKVSFTVRMTRKLAEIIGLVSKTTFRTIVLDDVSAIYVMGDGSVFKAFHTGLDYTTPETATEPSSGGIAISRYNEKTNEWEYADRCPDEETMKEYIRILAHRRRKLQ